MEKINITWALPEYEHEEKTSDWFLALGIVIITASATSFLLKNYFFALLLLIGGALMWYFARKEPEIVRHELNEDGLVIKNRLYPYESIKSFFVSLDPKPMLFIRSSRQLMPIMSMPIEEYQAEEIRMAFLKKDISEEKMEDHISDHIMNAIGF